MLKKHPAAAYYIVLMAVVSILATWPVPFYWIHGGEFDLVQLMGETIQRSGVELRTSALIPLLEAVSSEPALVALVFASAIPSIVALIMCFLTFGRKGLRELVGRLRPWRNGVSIAEGLRIWAAAVGFMVMVYLSMYALRYAIGGAVRESLVFNHRLLTPAVFWLFLEALLLNQGGLLEELGIRGYLQPLINQRARSPLRASLVVGVLWALFHVPRDVAFGTMSTLGPANYAIFFLLFAAWCIGGSVIIGYFFNRTGGSALIAISLHGLLNDSWRLGGILDSQPLAELVTRALVVAVFAASLAVIAGPRLGTWTRERTGDLAEDLKNSGGEPR